MHWLPAKLICTTVIFTLCFQSICVSGHVCHCIRIKDCSSFVRLLLNHRPEDRAAVFSMVHSAGCGFQGLDPLVCCPQQQQQHHHESLLHNNNRIIRFAPPTNRWVWDAAPSSFSSRSNPRLNRFMAYETERHLHDYRDFHAQRNCPQPIDDDDYDEHDFGHYHSGHHYKYQVEHRSQTPRPAPKDRPIVFPGDLRFLKSIETKGDVELMAAASQEQVIQQMGAPNMVMDTPPFLATSTTSVLVSRLNSEDCGISLSTRIQGGEEAQPGQYPWLARIAYRNRTNGRISYRCSGSLISNNYIVTAAHCVVNLVTDLELFQVRIGDDSPGAKDCAASAANCSNPNLFGISRVLVHPNYDQPKYANDIALLSLNSNLANFTPICLPLNSTSALANRLIGQMGVVAGWSTTSENNSSANSSSSTSVRFIRLPIVNTTSCAIAYASLSENFQQPIVITPNHLCAQGQPMNDVCRGDSGGPFMDDGTSGLINANGRYSLLGIVAFGPTLCGVTTIPGVYTAVSSFMSWIFDSIRNNVEMPMVNT
ncbi:hypothetical protein ACLKA6_016642 [Drosophila palustris]